MIRHLVLLLFLFVTYAHRDNSQGGGQDARALSVEAASNFITHAHRENSHGAGQDAGAFLAEDASNLEAELAHLEEILGRKLTQDEIMRENLTASITVEELISNGFSSGELRSTVDPGLNGCAQSEGEFTAPIKITIESKGEAELSGMRTDCFTRARVKSNLYQDENLFLKSLQSAHAIGAGGISGAQHFITEDGRFYLKTIPHKDEIDVLKGKFLTDYVKHLEKYDNSLLSRMVAMFKFSIPRLLRSPIEHYVLAMDNAKYDIAKSDNVLTFDLKGSKWKHRVKKDGGRRCSPLFPFEFFGDRPGKHEAEGEDLDFFAVRTQVDAKWFDSQRREVHDVQNRTWSHLLAERLNRYPLNDKCMENEQFIYAKTKKKDDYNFCEELAKRVKQVPVSVEDARAAHLLQKVTPLSERVMEVVQNTSFSKRGWTPWASSNPCMGLEGWKEVVLSAKEQLENVREYFGIGTTEGHEMEVKPLVVEPCVHKMLKDQVAADVQLLRENELLDYSMVLSIKYEPGPVACARQDNTTAALEALVDKGYIAERKSNALWSYKGGIRAVPERDAPAEKAVYIMQIADFLAPWKWVKNFSRFIQSGRANKVETRMPEILMDLTKLTGVGKCESMSNMSSNGGRTFCWSNCGAHPGCHRYGKNLADNSTDHLEDLAYYDFHEKFSDNNLACNGMLDAGKSRTLCAAVPWNLGSGSSKSLHEKLSGLKALPEPFKSEMTDGEIEVELSRPDVRNVLKHQLKQAVHPSTPMPLKRIAAMAYFDFARKPFETDTVPVDEYAQRFTRFMDSWISSPPQHEFEATCPNTVRCPATR